VRINGTDIFNFIHKLLPYMSACLLQE